MHRNINPNSIIIEKDGFIKLTSFEHAKIFSDEQLENSNPQGTLDQLKYKAPELIQRRPHSKIVDWWALGVTIYEMVMGVTAFEGATVNAVIAKIKTEEITFPDKEIPLELSDELADLIRKILQKQDHERLGFNDDAEEILAHPFFHADSIENQFAS